MNKVRFFLKEPNILDKETLIYFFYSSQGCKLKLSTKIKADPKNWDIKKQRFKKIAGTGYKEYNRILDSIENTFISALLNEGPQGATIDRCRQIYNEAVMKKENNSTAFLPYYFSYIEKVKATRGYKNAKPYISAYSRIKCYVEENRVSDAFENIDERFFSGLVDHLEKNRYSKNYIGAVIKKLKRIMEESFRLGFHKSTAYKNFKTMSEDVYNVYLSVDEINKLIALDLVSEKDQAARDLFVFACYTGIRIENAMNIDQKTNIDLSEKTLKIIVNKGGGKVTIPLNTILMNILEKWQGIPKVGCEQKFRIKIKNLCKMAGFVGKTEWTRTEGGKKTIHAEEKHKMVSTHTARRSFATNAYKAGIPIVNIMQITGHRSVKTFLKYVKIDDEENVALLKEHPFFH